MFCQQKSYNNEKKLENNKRAGWNKRAGRKVFSKLINVQTKIRPYRVDFFLKINKRACTSIRYTRVFRNHLNYPNHIWDRLKFMSCKKLLFVGGSSHI